jgi:type I restriction enzyme S subunit
MSAYPKYKKCDGDWIKEIPQDWDIVRGKYLFEIKKRIAGELGHNVLSITQKGIKVKDTESGDGQLSMDYSKYQIVEPGDFAMNHMDLLTGYVDISKYDGVTSPDYRVFTAREKAQCSRYFLYVLQMGYTNKIFFKYGQGASHLGRWRLPSDGFNDFWFPCPPQQVRATIVDYLDYEIGRIDTLINKQQKLLKLLKVKRQAVISHAVTQGINPKVIKHDSGVEWLGKVPQHWVNTKIKYIAELTPKKSEVEKEKRRTCSFIPMEKLKVDSLILDENKLISDVFDGYTYFRDEDILMAKVTPCFENKNMVVARNLTNSIGFGSSEIYVLRAKIPLLNDYLYYRLQEDVFMGMAIGAMTGAGGLKRVPSDFVNSFKVSLPPEKERLEIVDYIKKYTSEFDPLISKALCAIKLMRERRSSLIFSAVTGKIDVRNYEIKEQENNNKTY